MNGDEINAEDIKRQIEELPPQGQQAHIEAFLLGCRYAEGRFLKERMMEDPEFYDFLRERMCEVGLEEEASQLEREIECYREVVAAIGPLIDER